MIALRVCGKMTTQISICTRQQSAHTLGPGLMWHTRSDFDQSHMNHHPFGWGLEIAAYFCHALGYGLDELRFSSSLGREMNQSAMAEACKCESTQDWFLVRWKMRKRGQVIAMAGLRNGEWIRPSKARSFIDGIYRIRCEVTQRLFFSARPFDLECIDFCVAA